jgi:flagellar hook-basal body complex protein FliE
MSPLSSVTPSLATSALGGSAPTRAGGGANFKELLLRSIDDVNSMQQQADRAVETLMTGGEVDPAEVLTAVQKADMAFRMMMQMRNKMLAVYQEVKDIRI